jgi:hypothetical protein
MKDREDRRQNRKGQRQRRKEKSNHENTKVQEHERGAVLLSLPANERKDLALRRRLQFGFLRRDLGTKSQRHTGTKRGAMGILN